MIDLNDLFTPIEKWGKDHWSTFAYVETRVVDHRGYMDDRQLRGKSPQYPTRLKGYDEANPDTFITMHSDFDCIEDMVFRGLLVPQEDDMEWSDTSAYRNHGDRYALTDKGWAIAGQLRQHIAQPGSNYGNFTPEVAA